MHNKVLLILILYVQNTYAHRVAFRAKVEKKELK